MIWILLATLGIPIWLIVGALIAVWQIRRTVKRQPGVFEVSVRTAGADKWPRQPSYARVIRDVLVLTRGVALLRAEVHPVDAVTEFDLDAAPRKPADAVGRLVTFEDGTQREIAVAADHVNELDRAARPTRH
ncbi:MAG: hypothetical protein OEX04_08290 [Acidimicrobiia bacterium]|nr:hypothetical protein [Acidimicrobiia bacterium]